MTPEPTSLPILDAEQLLARLGHSREVLAQMAQILIQSVPNWQAELEASLAAGDSERLRRAAHQVKGAMMTFAAPRAADAAKRLEELGKTAQLHNARETATQLLANIELVVAEVKSLITQANMTKS